MAIEQLQKPDFFEGQYLGAADLDLAVDYNRFQVARHALGSHTWGIVSGLGLEEVPSGDGLTVDVYARPGLALDGYGRQIAVFEPYAIPLDRFEGLLAPSLAAGVGMPIRVWIRYVGTPFNAPPPGFENCDQDAYSRVQDGFDIIAGNLVHSAQHDTVVIGGADVHALHVEANREDTDPLWCDESIAYQSFPAVTDEPRWLVPLGTVRWDPVDKKLLPTSAPTEEFYRRASRVNRRYAGSITEEILATDGVIRLRNRESPPPADPTAELHEACDGAVIRTGDPTDAFSGSDLSYDAGRVSVDDLVWVEGNLRVTGNAKLFGTRLEFRDEDGSHDGVPLNLHRDESNGLKVNPADVTEGKDLRLAIGEAEDGINRLAVGPVLDDGGGPLFKPRVVVLDTGNVGIFDQEPVNSLQIGSGDLAIGDNGHRAGKLRLWQEADNDDAEVSHAIGTEVQHNTYGAGSAYPDSLGHKFYRGGDELIAQLGFGGPGQPDDRLHSHFAGNVGFGTTVATNAVQVEGDLAVPGAHRWGKIRLWQEANNDDTRVSHALGTEDWHNTYGAGPDYTNSIGHKFYRGGGQLIARIGFGGAGTPAKRLTSHFLGNVGIKTSAPTEALHVAGGLRVTGRMRLPQHLGWQWSDHTDRIVNEVRWKTAVDVAGPGILLLVMATSAAGHSGDRVRIRIDNATWLDLTGDDWTWMDTPSDDNAGIITIVPFRTFNTRLIVDFFNENDDRETGIRVNYLTM